MKANLEPNPYRAQDAFDEKLSRAIGISLLGHLIVFLVLAVRLYLSPSQPLQLESVIKVDIVSLPDKLPKTQLPLPEPVAEKPSVPQPPAPVAKPVAKPAPPVNEAPTVNLNKSKLDQQSALKRLEALARLEKMARAAPSPSAETVAATQPVAAPVPIKGNQISTGESLKGIARLEHRSYLGIVDQQIKRRWILPQWLSSANLSARVRIFVDSRGNVVKKMVTRSSQNPVYDERMIKAIEESSPLAPPPADLANLLAVEGMELEFVPQ